MRDEWIRFAAAALQGELIAKTAHESRAIDRAVVLADAMMDELDKRVSLGGGALGRLPEPTDWTWGEVEIFGRRSHLGRYRWTAGERFLDVEELLIERIDGALVERVQALRYGAKAIFSVSSRPEADIRAAARPAEPYEPHGRGNASDHPERRESHPPRSSDAPESMDF